MVKSVPSKKAQKRKDKEAELLESSWKLASHLYGQMWGERWETLREALLETRVPLVCLNYYTDNVYAASDRVREAGGSFTKCQSMQYYRPEDQDELDKVKETGGIVELDPESLLILNSISPISDQDHLLDMFSNTKSTTMALLQLMKTEQFTATINQNTPDKYQKMKSIVYETVSKKEEERLRLTGWDPIKFGVSETQIYDKVICDVPGSNEGKVFKDDRLMRKWTDKVGLNYV
jgi:16S rRNA C967 or C1407 C5-methylase (RsmB/RsmF family)